MKMDIGIAIGLDIDFFSCEGAAQKLHSSLRLSVLKVLS